MAWKHQYFFKDTSEKQATFGRILQSRASSFSCLTFCATPGLESEPTGRSNMTKSQKAHRGTPGGLRCKRVSRLFPSQWAADDVESLSFAFWPPSLTDTQLTWSVRLRAWPSAGHGLISFIPNHHGSRGTMNSALVKDYLQQRIFAQTKKKEKKRQSALGWKFDFILFFFDRCCSCHDVGEASQTFFSMWEWLCTEERPQRCNLSDGWSSRKEAEEERNRRRRSEAAWGLRSSGFWHRCDSQSPPERDFAFKLIAFNLLEMCLVPGGKSWTVAPLIDPGHRRRGVKFTSHHITSPLTD